MRDAERRARGGGDRASPREELRGTFYGTTRTERPTGARPVGRRGLTRGVYRLFALRRLTSTLRAASKRCDTSFQFHTFQIASKNSVFRFSYWR